MAVGAARKVLGRAEAEIAPVRVTAATIILLGVALVALWLVIQLPRGGRSRSRAG